MIRSVDFVSFLLWREEMRTPASGSFLAFIRSSTLVVHVHVTRFHGIETSQEELGTFSRFVIESHVALP